MIQNRWKQTAVIGAAGKMGRGISLLLLQEMARRDAEENGSVGQNDYRLTLIDTDEEAVHGLRRDFRPHLIRFAEKGINQIRSYFLHREDLIENRQIINEFVEGALDILWPATELPQAKKALLIFEAAPEDIALKTKILSTLRSLCPEEAFFFTNTSSIPIKELEENSGIVGRLAGAHFYNPPAHQKLLEVIYPEGASEEIKNRTEEIAKAFGKKIVFSKDVAGFIGNGHFIREIAFACDLYERLLKKHSHIESLVMVDTMTRDFLIRPMGIFQLLDYVGLDVWKKISRIMTEKVPLEGIIKPLLDGMVERGKIGGQEKDGRQKEGFFRYRNNRIAEAYDLDNEDYTTLDEDTVKRIGEFLGPLPENHIPWKKAHTLSDREEKMKVYEKSLRKTETLGAAKAAEFLDHSRKAAAALVETGVAASLEDVKTVLKNGFYHVLV